MATMSGNSGDFVRPGGSVGLEVWRIEKLHAVPVAAKDRCKLYSGDCYIILHTYEDKLRKRQMDLFYWLGSKSSQDEQGAVAYKTVELDDQLNGKPVQHREVQFYESPEFHSLPWGGSIMYLEGGMDSAFRRVDPSAYKPRLFHCKGKRNVLVQQVELTASSLNEGDVFILDGGLTLYQWNGSGANRYEKVKGLELLTKINSDERGGKAQLVFLESADQNEAFWKVLGGRRGVKKADQVPSDDEVKDCVVQLHQVADGSSSHVASGLLEKAWLDSNKMYLVDSGTNVYIWIGGLVPKGDRAAAMSCGQNYLKANNRPNWTPLTRVVEGAEAPALKALFKVWNPPTKVDFDKPAAARKQAEADTGVLFRQQQKQAEEKMVSVNGTVRVWRIENFNKVELDPSLYGQFFAGDSYIVLYTWMAGSRENVIIYFWQGRHSSQDEKTTSAFLTKQTDDQYGGQATQVRVVQGKEPQHFHALFKGKLIIHSGGKASGFANRHDVDTSMARTTSLYHVRGTTEHNTHGVQVDALASSLNSGDCFILTTPSRVYEWSGQGSSVDERSVSHNLAKVLANGRPMSAVAEGSEPGDFWAALGGKTEYATSKELASGDHPARLFHCSNVHGHFKITEVFNFSQEDLINDDVMMLDAFSEVFVWVGHESVREEREKSLAAALKYAANAPDGRDKDTPVYLVHAGNEPPSFTCHFLAWDHHLASDFEDPYAKKLAAVSAGQQQAEAESKSGAARDKPPAPVRVVSGSGSEADAAAAAVGFHDPSTTVLTLEEAQRGGPHVDPSRREQYLSNTEFQQLFGCTKAEFVGLQSWKRDAAKKKNKLF